MKTATAPETITTRSNEEVIVEKSEAWVQRLRDIRDRRAELLKPIEDELAALEEEAGDIRDEAYATIVEDGWSKVPALGAELTIVRGQLSFNKESALAEMSERTYNRVRSDAIDVSKVKKAFPGIYRRNSKRNESHLRINGL